MGLDLAYRIPIVQIENIDLVISRAKCIDFFIHYLRTARKGQLRYLEWFKDSFLREVHYFEEPVLTDGEDFLVWDELAEGYPALVEFGDEVEFRAEFVVDVS